MKSIRVSYDRYNGRRDRRHPLPPLTVAAHSAEYVTVNWSLGGFLIAGHSGALAPGERFTGTVRVNADTAPVEFTAVVVRVDEPEPGNVACQFTDIDDRLVTLLERAITRRMFRG
jgi:PilZ domain